MARDLRLVVRALATIGGLALTLGLAAAVMGFIAVKKGFSARDEPSAAEAVIARALRTFSIPSRYEKLNNPVTATPQVVASAKAHWADHCAGCHANDGSGSTVIGKNLFPRAPDMRANATQKLSDGELYFIIENGIRLTGMPAWGDGKDDNQASWELVVFIRQLPKLTAEEVDAMKALNPRSARAVREDEDDERFLNDEDNEDATEHSHQGTTE